MSGEVLNGRTQTDPNVLAQAFRDCQLRAEDRRAGIEKRLDTLENCSEKVKTDVAHLKQEFAIGKVKLDSNSKLWVALAPALVGGLFLLASKLLGI